jgi:hypothetical protein
MKESTLGIAITMVLTAAITVGVDRTLLALLHAIDEGMSKRDISTVTQVAEQLEEYRRLHGSYPAGASLADLGDDFSHLPDHLFYCSDGSTYIAVYAPLESDNERGSAYSFVIHDGHWLSWPRHSSDASLRRSQRRLDEIRIRGSQSNSRLELSVTPLACARVAPAA